VAQATYQQIDTQANVLCDNIRTQSFAFVYISPAGTFISVYIPPMCLTLPTGQAYTIQGLEVLEALLSSTLSK